MNALPAAAFQVKSTPVFSSYTTTIKGSDVFQLLCSFLDYKRPVPQIKLSELTYNNITNTYRTFCLWHMLENDDKPKIRENPTE